jgi:hypothetical protein
MWRAPASGGMVEAMALMMSSALCTFLPPPACDAAARFTVVVVVVGAIVWCQLWQSTAGLCAAQSVTDPEQWDKAGVTCHGSDMPPTPHHGSQRHACQRVEMPAMV